MVSPSRGADVAEAARNLGLDELASLAGSLDKIFAVKACGGYSWDEGGLACRVNRWACWGLNGRYVDSSQSHGGERRDGAGQARGLKQV